MELNQLDVVHRVRLLDVGAEIEVVEHLTVSRAGIEEREKLRKQTTRTA